MPHTRSKQNELSRFLEGRRTALGLTPEQVAEQAGVRVEQYRQWEYGYTNPPDDTMPRLADSLKAPVKVLEQLKPPRQRHKRRSQREYRRPIERLLFDTPIPTRGIRVGELDAMPTEEEMGELVEVPFEQILSGIHNSENMLIMLEQRDRGITCYTDRKDNYSQPKMYYVLPDSLKRS